MNPGRYDKQIKRNIRNCKDFIVVIPPNGLDKCINENDWIRREVVDALRFNKNIIPVMMKDFDETVYLPKDMSDLLKYTGVKNVNGETYDQAIVRINELLKSKPIMKYRHCIEAITAITAVIFCLIFIAKGFIYDYSTIESVINDDLKIESSISEIATSVNYKAATNIVNGGLGCFDGSKYYFGDGFLRSEDVSSGNVNMIYNDTVYYLNVADDYLYFSLPSEGYAVCRIKKDGTSFEKLYNNYCYELTYYDGWLYFCSDMGGSDYHICRMQTDGTNFTVLANCREWYMNIYNDQIFFCNYDDGQSIYSMNIDGTNYKLLRSGECCDLCVVNGKIYFSTDMNTRWLYSIDINGTNETLLRDSYTRFTNYFNDKLYFVNSEGMISSCDLNGDNTRVLYSSTSYSFILLFPGKICCNTNSNNNLIVFNV